MGPFFLAHATAHMYACSKQHNKCARAHTHTHTHAHSRMHAYSPLHVYSLASEAIKTKTARVTGQKGLALAFLKGAAYGR